MNGLGFSVNNIINAAANAALQTTAKEVEPYAQEVYNQAQDTYNDAQEAVSYYTQDAYNTVSKVPITYNSSGVPVPAAAQTNAQTQTPQTSSTAQKKSFFEKYKVPLLVGGGVLVAGIAFFALRR